MHYNNLTQHPEGDVCFACWTAYVVGQFKVQYGSIKKVRQKIDADMMVAKEFKATSVMVVRMVNNGEMSLKSRATDKHKTTLQQARAKVVKEFKGSEQLVDANYKHMTPARYKEVHGRTHDQDNLALECAWVNN